MAKVMVDMELDDEDKIDAIMPIAMPSKPDYPYGLRLCLTAKEMEKLGLDPADLLIGGMIHLHAIAKITDISITDNEAGKNARAELQITSMCCVESEDAENAAAEQKMRRNPLHDNERS